MNTKKILASLLAIAAACTMSLAAVAISVEEPEADGNEVVAVAEEAVTVTVISNGEETTFDSVAAAINAAKDYDTVVLGAGEYSPISVSGKNITLAGTLDEDGNHLTVIKGGNPAISAGYFSGTIKDIKIVDAWKVLYGEPIGSVVFDNLYVTGATYGIHPVAYTEGVEWKIQNCYMVLAWANSFGVAYGAEPNIIVKNNVFESTSPYYPDYGSPAVNTYSPNVTVEDNIFGKNAKIYIDAVAVPDTSNIVIGNNYYADGAANAFVEDVEGVKVPIYTEYKTPEMEEVIYNTADTKAVVGDKCYSSLKEALADATENAVITLTSDVEEGTITFANINNVTIDGDGYSIKNTLITNAGKATDSIVGLTIDDVDFENSRIYINGWTAGMVFEDWAITNCTFTGLESDTSIGGVIQFNLSSAMISGQYGPYNDCALENFKFTGNTVDGAHCNGVCSAINSQAMEGTIIIENNTFNDVDFNAIQLQNVPETATVSIKNNTFTNAGAQILHLNNNLAAIKVNENVFVKPAEVEYYITHISTTIDASDNYYGIGTSVENAEFDKDYASKMNIKSGVEAPVIYGHYTDTDMSASGYTDLVVAKIGEEKFTSLNAAVDAAENGDVIVIAPGTYNEVLNITKSIVLTGDPNYGTNGATLAAVTEKPVINISTVTNGGVQYHAPNVVFDNLVFNVLEDATGAGWNVSAIGYYYEIVKDRDGLTVTNCDFINNSKISMSAIAANIAKYTVKNNTFKNFTTMVHSFVDHGALGEVVVSDNTFENVENIVSVYWGAENAAATLTVKDNKSTDGSNAKIIVDDFGKTKATPVTAIPTATISGNDAEITLLNYDEASNDYTIGNNAAAPTYSYASEEIMRKMDGKLPDGVVYVAYGAADQQMFIVVDGYVKTEAESVELVFVPNTTYDAKALENSVWDLVLIASDAEIINRLNSADFTFELTTDEEKDAMAYEIIATNDEVAINNVNNSADRYEFHYENKDASVETDTALRITLGTVKFTGFGAFTFKVDTTDVAENTNQAHATTFVDNIVDSYTVNAGTLTVNNTAEDADGDTDFGTIDSKIIVPTKALTINIDFPNAVADNKIAYQQMKVVVSGGELEAPLTIDLGTDYVVSDLTVYDNKENVTVTVTENNPYAIVITNLLEENTAYTVEVSGEGYRTAKYTVTMTKDKTLNFWNNVKDNAIEVEEGKDSSAKNVTFLAGDIVKDGTINIYDLSAVVSYFGEIDLVEDGMTKYAKYDLNRDGKIDSKDVAYVLVSWGK